MAHAEARASGRLGCADGEEGRIEVLRERTGLRKLVMIRDLRIGHLAVRLGGGQVDLALVGRVDIGGGQERHRHASCR